MKQKYTIAVAGTGYVGLSMAVLLAQHHHVLAVDIVPEKVERINNRISPIQDAYIERYFAEKDLQKECVDVISCVFKTWNKKKQEWMEREVYFDVEKEWPDLEQGDFVHYVVQSNFLIRYEVLQRQALTAEELGEDE